MSVDVGPSHSRSDMREFIELPFRLHSNAALWIPPLRIERRLFLSPRIDAFFEHGEAQLFLARRDGRVVGRISAQIDRAFNDFQGNAWGMFGFLELEDDLEVMRGAARRGRRMAAGARPRPDGRADGLHDERRERDPDRGLRAEPMIRQAWHPPYYKRLCEEAGLEKAVDPTCGTSTSPAATRCCRSSGTWPRRWCPKHGIRLRRWRRHLRRELDVFAEIYNEAWRKNFGFVPYTKHDLDAYAQELQLAFDRDFFMVVEDAKGRLRALRSRSPTSTRC